MSGIATTTAKWKSALHRRMTMQSFYFFGKNILIEIGLSLMGRFVNIL